MSGRWSHPEPPLYGARPSPAEALRMAGSCGGPPRGVVAVVGQPVNRAQRRFVARLRRRGQL
jgi:hypothetical protein